MISKRLFRALLPISLLVASAAIAPSQAAPQEAAAAKPQTTSAAPFLRPLPPRLSHARLQYYASHPDEWRQFMAQLPPIPTRTNALSAKAEGAASAWQPVTAPAPAFYLASPQLLTDGTVLVHESCSRYWYKLTPDINGSYINGTWSAIAPMPSGYEPLYYASAILSDGRLIINGGEFNNSSPNLDCSTVSGNYVTLGAIYDPVNDFWTPVAPPSGWTTIGDAESTVLANGTYMLASCCASPPAAALFNASTLTWTPTGTGKADSYSEEGWTLLPSGFVFTADAYVNTGSCGRNTEIYNPLSGSWTSAGASPTQLADCGPPKPTYEIGPAVLRPDGTVVAFSGLASGAPAGTAIYRSYSRDWLNGPLLPAINGQNFDLADASASWLPTGNILFAASPGYANPPTHFFEFSTANTITQVADTPNSPNFPSYPIYFLLLPTGQVLATDYTNIVEIYTPSGPVNRVWGPRSISVPSTLRHGQSYTLRGLQLNGLTQGALYGDDAQSATNYPLVRITNNATRHVFYARTYNFLTRSIAWDAPSMASFVVPGQIELGASSLAVVTNGIPSAPISVTIE